MRQQEVLELQGSRGPRPSPVVRLINWLINIFIVEKFCQLNANVPLAAVLCIHYGPMNITGFVILGVTFGVVLAKCLQYTDHNSDFSIIQNTVISQASHTLQSEDVNDAPSSPVIPSQAVPQFDNEFLNGLAAGMSIVKKNPPSTSKQVRVLYIIGNGWAFSLHLLWNEYIPHHQLPCSVCFVLIRRGLWTSFMGKHYD